MDDLKTLDLVYCFQKTTFEAAMRDFMTPPHVVQHNMVVRELLDQARRQTRNG